VARHGSAGQSGCGLLLGSSPSSFGTPHAEMARTPTTTSVAIVTRRFTLCHSTTRGGRSCGYAAPIDAFEQHVRASLHVLGYDVDETEIAVMRVADGVYGPQLRALVAADLSGVWAEPDMDPSRAPSARFPAGIE